MQILIDRYGETKVKLTQTEVSCLARAKQIQESLGKALGDPERAAGIINAHLAANERPLLVQAAGDTS